MTCLQHTTETGSSKINFNYKLDYKTVIWAFVQRPIHFIWVSPRWLQQNAGLQQNPLTSQRDYFTVSPSPDFLCFGITNHLAGCEGEELQGKQAGQRQHYPSALQSSNRSVLTRCHLVLTSIDTGAQLDSMEKPNFRGSKGTHNTTTHTWESWGQFFTEKANPQKEHATCCDLNQNVKGQ